VSLFRTILSVACVLCFAAKADEGSGPKPSHGGLAYAPLSKAQVLDLFLPAGDGPFPLVINIHGGAFMLGDKGMLNAEVARAFLDAGFAVASLDYRLSGEAKFPAAVQDVKAAVRFLRANAGKYRLDGGRFLAFGQSAGGNLASMLGTSGGEAMFEDAALGNAGVSSRVQAVIDWFGPTDFAKMDEQAREQGCLESAQRHGEFHSPESRYLGAPLAEVPELVRQANPASYATRDDPPFVLQKGERDCMVPVGQSQLLHDALKAAGVAAELEIIPGAGHGDMGSSVPRFMAEENIARLVAFAKAALK
jgi:acetyl esterase/lipase